jgi:hypothetical protein
LLLLLLGQEPFVDKHERALVKVTLVQVVAHDLLELGDDYRQRPVVHVLHVEWFAWRRWWWWLWFCQCSGC